MIKWVARLAFLTILLGLIGSILILSDVFKPGGEKKLAPKVNDTLIHRATTDTPKIILQEKHLENVDTTPLPPPIIPPKKEDTIKKIAVVIDTPKKADTAKVLKQEAKKKIDKADTPVKAKKSEVVKKPRKVKLFTQSELQRLVFRINTFKAKNRISANCVQMHITEQGYSKRTLSQIETYLKSKHFSIAGREVIAKEVYGIQIKRAGTCTRIIIGSF
ncbi:hypothetical protein [Segetibacter aerophilus]|uniref:Uncharacterized protein n=1 Tax=Segetibacter aerophilus TaxID=670293 RepID=A0A512BA03_9BACT|nr:hypothetical protein [Segetibacter aerophilus]GEO08647.1 hypothetical protein SAE01_11430 [Segetibacter aerophilus]